MSIRICGDNTVASPAITSASDTDTGLQFGTNEVKVVNGDLDITDGNLKVASGHGIDFSADAHAAGMANELLDDYEEGTWTPSAVAYSGTLTINSANYVKIGNLVHIQMYISFSNTADSSNVIIDGLPFTAGGSVGNEFCLLTAHTSSSLSTFAMRARGTSNMIEAVYQSGSSGDAKPDFSSLASKFIIMGGTYYAV